MWNQAKAKWNALPWWGKFLVVLIGYLVLRALLGYGGYANLPAPAVDPGNWR